MINNLTVIMGITADILSILSIWCIDADSSTWMKVVITGVALAIGIAIVFFAHDTYDIRVKNYYYKENEDEFRVYTKKNRFLVGGSVVSLYYKYKEHENNYDKLVAIGYVFLDDNEKEVQIKIFKVIEESLMRKILSSSKSCRNYHIKPNIEYTQISNIFIGESEASYNV